MDAVMEYFIDSYGDVKGRNIEEEDREFLQRKFDKMYVTKDIYTIYNKLLAVCGQEQMAELPYERRKIQHEDVFRCRKNTDLSWLRTYYKTISISCN